jgi:hypothetical protein
LFGLFDTVKNMQKITLILVGLVVVCQCLENHLFRLQRSVSEDSKTSYEESDTGINDEKEESEEHDYCMPQCSYTCIATNGNLETCSALLKPTNTTLINLPSIDTCPTDSTLLTLCYMRCDCHCNRCAVCYIKNQHAMDIKNICSISSDEKKCLKEKNLEAVKACD